MVLDQAGERAYDLLMGGTAAVQAVRAGGKQESRSEERIE